MMKWGNKPLILVTNQKQNITINGSLTKASIVRLCLVA